VVADVTKFSGGDLLQECSIQVSRDQYFLGHQQCKGFTSVFVDRSGHVKGGVGFGGIPIGTLEDVIHSLELLYRAIEVREPGCSAVEGAQILARHRGASPGFVIEDKANVVILHCDNALLVEEEFRGGFKAASEAERDLLQSLGQRSELLPGKVLRQIEDALVDVAHKVF
jgi:hypothetical protein